MELINKEELNNYIIDNCKLILKTNKWDDYQNSFDGFCNYCNRDVFLKIHSKTMQNYSYQENYSPVFINLFIECPRCKKRCFRQCILINVSEIIGKDEENEDIIKTHLELYHLYDLPIKNEMYENKDIPDGYKILKRTIGEAIFAMQHEKNISAVIMFRRALQIIVKEILGAEGGKLYKQLEWLKENDNKLSINLSKTFHDNSELIRLVGNQGAHVEEDLSLQAFSNEDVKAIYDLFLVLIYDVFVLPARIKETQDELKAKRKL